TRARTSSIVTLRLLLLTTLTAGPQVRHVLLRIRTLPPRLRGIGDAGLGLAGAPTLVLEAPSHFLGALDQGEGVRTVERERPPTGSAQRAPVLAELVVDPALLDHDASPFEQRDPRRLEAADDRGARRERVHQNDRQAPDAGRTRLRGRTPEVRAGAGTLAGEPDGLPVGRVDEDVGRSRAAVDPDVGHPGHDALDQGRGAQRGRLDAARSARSVAGVEQADDRVRVAAVVDRVLVEGLPDAEQEPPVEVALDHRHVLELDLGDGDGVGDLAHGDGTLGQRVGRLGLLRALGGTGRAHRPGGLFHVDHGCLPGPAHRQDVEELDRTGDLLGHEPGSGRLRQPAGSGLKQGLHGQIRQRDPRISALTLRPELERRVLRDELAEGLLLLALGLATGMDHLRRRLAVVLGDRVETRLGLADLLELLLEIFELGALPGDFLGDAQRLFARVLFADDFGAEPRCGHVGELVARGVAGALRLGQHLAHVGANGVDLLFDLN